MHLQQRILVTGGSGFLGSHLCERLLASAANVLCLDNFFTGSRANLLDNKRFELIRHDVTFPIYLEVDEIYSLACPAGMKTACFRGGCLTGPGHSGTQLHGFLSYLMKCAVSGQPYNVLGYKGKQVRDNIHSFDLVNAFWHFFQSPRSGEVYNIGGGRYANVSMLEAIDLCEQLTGRPMNWSYVDNNRIGDHIWWVSDIHKFQSHYPMWRLTCDIRTTLAEIFDVMRVRTAGAKVAI